MNKKFYLIAWKEFEDKKVINKAEVIHSEDVEQDLEKVKQVNAQKRLVTVEYTKFNLSELFEKNHLTIKKE